MFIVIIYYEHMFEIKSKITIKVLGYFFINPDVRKYINELASILGVDLGNLDKKLKELSSEGILSCECLGREKYYFLNKDYPLLQEVQRIYDLKYGLESKIREALENVDGLQEVYLFGSYVKGGFGPDSDVDILLVGSHSSLEAKKSILALQKEMQREFNIIDLSSEEFLEKKKNNDEFLLNIFDGENIKII